MPRFGDDWASFGPSRPIPVAGGIVTSKQRGQMAESWWSQRFVTMLESYGLGGRMQRGRRYARTGQVVSLAVAPGRLEASVQGSRPKPYQVTIAARPPDESQWRTLEDAFRARIGFAARLLAGEVPPDLEAVFEGVGVTLFPRRWADLRAVCSCPDDANPCKHIAAVLYVFADQLDADPWLLLAWRGRTREQILGDLAVAAGPAVRSPSEMLPPWWPLTPDGRATERARPAIPVSIPPDPADRVLERMAPLTSSVVGPEIVELLCPAYEALRPRV
ncbi:MAG: SWIM zinc finger family protein [Acidimicrobiales bacterium]